MAAEAISTQEGVEPRKVYPLSKLSESISMQLERSFAGAYWITAEISKLNFYPQSGHCYPQLVEKRDGKIVADIRAFILNSKFVELRSQFEAVNGKPLDDGMQIMFRCKVTYHAVYGLSLNIIDIEPAYTLGEMARMRNEALKKLQSSGAFAQNKMLRLPLLLRRLAIISVDTSKGWRDFSNSINESPYGNAIETTLFPALMQGDAAIESIARALRRIQALHDSFDAICIIRGGGGETGLDCYDNYGLAELVCTFPLPVLTGIGHATNLTLVEQVAHRNLITPTALAGFVIEGFSSFSDRILAASQSLYNVKRGILRGKILELQATTDTLITMLKARMVTEHNELYMAIRHFESTARKGLQSLGVAVQFKYPSRLGEATKRRLQNEVQGLDSMKPSLLRAFEQLRSNEGRRLDLFDQKAKLLDPVNTLKRGYSLSTSNGRLVTKASDLKPGDTIQTQFVEGSAQSTIDLINP